MAQRPRRIVSETEVESHYQLTVHRLPGAVHAQDARISDLVGDETQCGRGGEVEVRVVDAGVCADAANAEYAAMGGIERAVRVAGESD